MHASLMRGDRRDLLGLEIRMAWWKEGRKEGEICMGWQWHGL
jgi:hypothetical protein